MLFDIVTVPAHILNKPISKKAAPGAQVMVIKNGKVIFDQTFGHHTYKKKSTVRKSDLYDLASITKVSATSLAAMKLFEEKRFKLADRLKSHLELDKESGVFPVVFLHTGGTLNYSGVTLPVIES